MMVRWILTSCLAMQIAISGIWSHAAAQSIAEIRVPSDSKFVLQFDLQAVRKSKVGGVLFDAIKKAAIEELEKSKNENGFDLNKVNDILGFDPFEEVQGVVISAADFDNPEKSLIGLVRLKKNSGNIEGLLLNLPGYEKSSHGKHDIHSASPDEDSRFFGAIHTADTGNKTLVISPNKDSVTQLLDSLDNTQSDSKAFKSVPIENDRKVLLNLQLLELPTDKLGEGPQANIAALLKSVSFQVTESDDDLDIFANLTTDTKKQAEQIRQSIQGIYAMIQLAQSIETEDEDLKEFNQFLKGVKVTTNEESITVKIKIPSDVVAELIKKEIESQ